MASCGDPNTATKKFSDECLKKFKRLAQDDMMDICIGYVLDDL